MRTKTFIILPPSHSRLVSDSFEVCFFFETFVSVAIKNWNSTSSLAGDEKCWSNSLQWISANQMCLSTDDYDDFITNQFIRIEDKFFMVSIRSRWLFGCTCQLIVTIQQSIFYQWALTNSYNVNESNPCHFHFNIQFFTKN